MSRYIDADTLKHYGSHLGDEYEDKFHDAQWVYRNQIDEAPSIDIIKCKDCIYYEALGYDAPKDGWCNTPKLYCDGYWVDEDDFCSDAKKEEANES